MGATTVPVRDSNTRFSHMVLFWRPFKKALWVRGQWILASTAPVILHDAAEMKCLGKQPPH